MDEKAEPGRGGEVHGLVDHLFRRQASRLVALLSRSFGSAHLGLAEEVVQEAMLQALRRWPFSGIPERPVAWLYRVARNLALDRLRRDIRLRGKEAELRLRLVAVPGSASAAEVRLGGELSDDQLRLIFLCCHPELPRDSRVALTLKVVAGFSVAEIAGAFLLPPATLAQRLVRAKRLITARRLTLEMPTGEALPERLETVLEVVYLMFNEGYSAHHGEHLVRTELCCEALHLAEQLACLKLTMRPASHALAALLAFQASRLPVRLDAAGDLVRLEDQDRSRWDRGLLRRAFGHLSQAASGRQQGVYHLQAAIASYHAMAASPETTDWRSILELYDQLFALNPSAVVALNRAVAVARALGPRAGLGALAQIESRPAVAGYYLLGATRGELLAEIGNRQGAAASYRQALACTCSAPERRFLEARLASLGPLLQPLSGEQRETRG